MKVSVKYAGQVVTFPNVENACFKDFKAIVQSRFGIDSDFHLCLGASILDGLNEHLDHFGVVDGDRLFVGQHSHLLPIAVTSSSVLTTPTASTSISSPSIPRIVDYFPSNVVLVFRRLLTDNGFMPTDLPANWTESLLSTAVRFHCSHGDFHRVGQLAVMCYDDGREKASIAILRASSVGPNGRRIFTNDVIVRQSDDGIRQWDLLVGLLTDVKIMLLGYQCPLLDLLMLDDIRVSILTYLDARSIINLELTHPVSFDLCRSQLIDRSVWKRLLKKRFGADASLNAEKQSKSFRQAYEKLSGTVSAHDFPTLFRCLRCSSSVRNRPLYFPSVHPSRPFSPPSFDVGTEEIVPAFPANPLRRPGQPRILPRRPSDSDLDWFI